MHIRTSRVRRGDKLYEYAQLVETYRRESDGMPVHRVIAKLGSPGDIAVLNMQQALTAARQGKSVVVARQPPPGAAAVRPPKPTANLRYLDLAVLLEVWRGLGLDVMLDELLPAGDAGLRPASVVAALVLQRCVDPGSKLFATRWMPRTSLPELLDLAPSGFNNTRLHRVLDDLDGATTALMSKLPARYLERGGVFASLFMDVTDTWFVGDGPSMSERGKTKEGRVDRKIGIVLLCNEHGYPLRWQVVPGCQSDSRTMTEMLRSIAGLSWASDTPVVCDRSMGKTAHLREMVATRLRFLTALTVTEFDSYAQGIPHAPFALLSPTDAQHRAQDVEQAAQCAQTAGMQKVEDDLFVLDLGIVERADGEEPSLAAPSADDPTLTAMRLCRQIEELVAQGRHASYAAAGRAVGLRKSVVSKYRLLGRLSEQQQQDVLEGKAAGCSLADLLRVAGMTARDEQQDAFLALLAAPRGQPRKLAVPAHSPAPPVATEAPIRVRVVAYFNPDRFVEQRLQAKTRLDRIHAFVTELNAKLSAPRSRHTERSVAAIMDRRLRQDALLDAFDVRITQRSSGTRQCFHVDAVLDEADWSRRRRYDGFTVLVGHHELPQSPAELCRLYRAKDAVEKDFQTIKSVVQLRPVRHYTDEKVRAHVTLCMLALLLERALRRRLSATAFTPEAAIEELATCHLNLFAGEHARPVYTITHANADQRAILGALRLQHLADDDYLAEKITPR